jgi:hypothetical protein
MSDKSVIVEKIVAGYIKACLWSSGDQDDEGNDFFYDEFEPSSQLKGEAFYLCALFYDANTKDCALFAEQYQPSQDYDVWECLGHDLWLTSAGHGVGFWDRGLDELGERLTEACQQKPYVDKCAYIGDDSLIYLS